MPTFKFKLPSGNVVEFEEPRFYNKQSATHYSKNKIANLTVDEALAAICIRAINGIRCSTDYLYPYDRDLIKNLTLKDLQTYTFLFHEMFTTLSEQDIRDIKKTAKNLLNTVQN